MFDRTTIAVMFVCVALMQANTQGQTYPWRANRNSQIVESSSTNRINGKRRKVAFVSISDQEQEEPLADTQPSVSDQSPVPPAPKAETSEVELPGVTAPLASETPAEVAPPVGQGLTNSWVQDGSVMSPEPAMTVQSNAGSGVTNYCDRDCRKPCCLGCERTLFGPTCNGTQIGGWASVGYHNRNNGLFNNHAGNVDLGQAWLFVDRQASRNQAGWDFGYRADTLYGLDAQDTQAFGNAPTGAPSGWDNGWDFGRHGWALPQFYVQAANCNWDVKVGKQFANFGYESIGSPNNFFYSRSFTRFYTEPFTLTGVIAERTMGNGQSYILGYTTGWDTGFENNSGGNLILGFRRRINRAVNVSFTASAGDTGYRDTGTFTSGVTEVQLTNNLRYALQTSVADLRTNQEFGVVQYLIRDINPCLAVGARVEWWKSDRFFGGANSSSYEFTMGANYRPNANLTLRPELRWDWGAIAAQPGQAIVGIDAVVTF